MLGEQKLMAVMNTVHLYTRPFSLESLGNLRGSRTGNGNWIRKNQKSPATTAPPAHLAPGTSEGSTSSADELVEEDS